MVQTISAKRIRVFIMNIYIFLMFILAAFLSSSAFSANWRTCASELDDLRRAAGDAGDAANAVKKKADEYENCKNTQEIFGTRQEDCHSKADDYQRALRYFESSLGTVNSRIRFINSCGAELSSASPQPNASPSKPGTGSDQCDLYRSYVNKLPYQTLLKTCTHHMTEADCRKCLSQ